MKLNREMYKDIKKMNREEMNKFLSNLYIDGFRQGAESNNNADFRIKLSEVLHGTKGVGVVLYDRIMDKAKGEK